MNRDTIADNVLQVISETLSIDRGMIHGESLMVEDLGCDSVHAVEIMFALQDIFNIKVPQAALAKIYTVDDIIDYLLKKMGRK